MDVEEIFSVFYQLATADFLNFFIFFPVLCFLIQIVFKSTDFLLNPQISNHKQ